MDQSTQGLQIADCVHLIFNSFLELHGDRKSGDDRTVIGGLARLSEYKLVVIGYQRELAVEIPGVTGPAGYRRCLRLAHLAETFGKPVIIFIDIPDSTPLSVSEQQTNEAVARYLEGVVCLASPIIGVIMSKSKGFAAIDMCVADRIIMLEDADYPNISLDTASAIDTKTPSSQELMDLDIVHRMVSQSSGNNIKSLADKLREAILEELGQLIQIHPEILVQKRLQKFQSWFLNYESFRLHFSHVDSDEY